MVCISLFIILGVIFFSLIIINLNLENKHKNESSYETNLNTWSENLQKSHHRGHDIFEVNPDFNRNKLRQLIDFWRSNDKRSKSITSKLEQELLTEKLGNNTLSFETYKQLSKWCDTGGTYWRSERIAREISIILFGIIIGRIE